MAHFIAEMDNTRECYECEVYCNGYLFNMSVALKIENVSFLYALSLK